MFAGIVLLSGDIEATPVERGMSASGLPIGAQFVARFGREDVLLRLASAFEQAMPWQ